MSIVIGYWKENETTPNLKMSIVRGREGKEECV